jgi:hypothetical protein
MAGLLGDTEDNRYVVNDITADGQGNIYLAGKKTIHTEPDPVTWIEYRDVMFLSKTDPAGTLTWTVEDTAFHRAEKIGYNQGSLYVLGSREEWRYIFNGGTLDTTSRCYYGSFDLSGTLLWDRSITGALAYDLFVSDESILLTGGLLLDQLELGDYQITRNSDSSSICPIYQDIFYLESTRSGTLKNLESISGSLEDIPTGIWLADNGDLLYTGTFESASLPVVQSEVYNNSKLHVFQHVSGIYYDRRIYSFLARHVAYAGPSGTEDRAQDPILLYPNPSDGLFTINSPNTRDAVRIRVFDMSGRIVYMGDAFQTPYQVDLRDQPEGMYILSFTGMKGSVRKSKLIIK